MNTPRVLVCDLDNTLYDWVHYYVSSFYAMVDTFVAATSCSRDQLLDELRAVHQAFHDSEHPLALLATPTMQTLRASIGGKADEAYEKAMEAMREVAKQELHLFPRVTETLAQLRVGGVRLLAHTESRLHAMSERLVALGLLDSFDAFYCRERPVSDFLATSGFQVRIPVELEDRVVELQPHQRKPDPKVLLEICSKEGALPADVLYVGDSMTHDMRLAKSAGVLAAWAKYGTLHRKGEYESLVRVSHWTPEDVKHEQRLQASLAGLTPDYVLERDFGEVLEAFL